MKLFSSNCRAEIVFDCKLLSCKSQLGNFRCLQIKKSLTIQMRKQTTTFERHCYPFCSNHCFLRQNKRFQRCQTISRYAQPVFCCLQKSKSRTNSIEFIRQRKFHSVNIARKEPIFEICFQTIKKDIDLRLLRCFISGEKPCSVQFCHFQLLSSQGCKVMAQLMGLYLKSHSSEKMRQKSFDIQ